MKILASYLSLFLFALVPLNADVASSALPACCAEACCYNGEDECSADCPCLGPLAGANVGCENCDVAGAGCADAEAGAACCGDSNMKALACCADAAACQACCGDDCAACCGDSCAAKA